MSKTTRVALVTGSTDGIGKQTALELLARGFRVIVHGRSDARVASAIAELSKRDERAAQETRIDGWSCDLSSLAAIRAAAPSLLTRAPRLDVFLHNAGVYAQERAVTSEGFELTLAVSHLAPFLLAHLLLPSLEAAAPARIVMVSSQVHLRGKLDFNNLQLERGYSGIGSYAQAKLCNVLFANGLAARFPTSVLTANSLHPGVVGTKLLKQGFGMSDGPDSLSQGAQTSVFLASAPEVANISGRYFDRSREATPAAAARSVELREQLWSASEALTGERWNLSPLAK